MFLKWFCLSELTERMEIGEAETISLRQQCLPPLCMRLLDVSGSLARVLHAESPLECAETWCLSLTSPFELLRPGPMPGRGYPTSADCITDQVPGFFMKAGSSCREKNCSFEEAGPS